MTGIALGRSEYTNGMIFYNPDLDSFCGSADFILDKRRHVGELFPQLIYDGGLCTSVVSQAEGTPTKFDIGQSVFVQCEETYNIFPASIMVPPTSSTKTYSVFLNDTEEIVDVEAHNIYTSENVPSPGKPSDSLNFSVQHG